MSTLALIVIVSIVALLAAGIGTYAGAMIAAGTIVIKLSERMDDGRTTRETTNTVD